MKKIFLCTLTLGMSCLAPTLFSFYEPINEHGFFYEHGYDEHHGFVEHDDCNHYHHDFFAFEDYGCPNECTPQESFELRASLLYFKPSTDESHYVISSTNNRFGENIFPDGRRHQNEAPYSPGFRLEGIFELNPCPTTLDLRFTYLHATHSDSTAGDFLFDTNGFPGDGAQAPEDTTYAGTARSRNRYKYYGAEGTYNRMIFDFMPDNLTFLIGLHYAYIQFREHTSSDGSFIDDNVLTAVTNRMIRDSHFWGIGPEIGLDYHYNLPQSHCIPGSFALNANARGSLLCGCTKSHLHYTTVRTGPVGVNIRNEHLWRVTPAANAQLGFSYSFGGQRCVATVELGYEFMWYSKCVDKITGVDVAFAGDTIDIFHSLNMHGPFLSLNIAY